MSNIAERLAYKVLESDSKGETKSRIAIARENNINENYANTRLPQTKSYQRIIAKYSPRITKQLIKHIDRSAKELNRKDLSKVSYKDLVTGIDTGIDKVQLLTGGATNNIALNISISEAIAKKNSQET